MLINPMVYDEKGKGSDVFSMNLDKRVIHLVGPIDDEMAASVVAQLLHLEAMGDDDIYLYINSPGGSVSAGMAIYDTMQYIKPDVATVCLGRAASMGAVLLSGGAKGKRMVLPHGEVMIHQPSGGMEGQASELLIAAEHIKETKKMLNEVLAENCGNENDKALLLRMAESFKTVPKQPAYDFTSAMCSFMLIFALDGSDSPGRFDQYMYPAYLKTKNKEEITARFDLLYDSIDDIIAQAKVGYIE